jgi:hypothetical protein
VRPDGAGEYKKPYHRLKVNIAGSVAISNFGNLYERFVEFIFWKIPKE